MVAEVIQVTLQNHRVAVLALGLLVAAEVWISKHITVYSGICIYIIHVRWLPVFFNVQINTIEYIISFIANNLSVRPPLLLYCPVLPSYQVSLTLHTQRY